MRQLDHAIVWMDHREAKVYRFSRYDEPPVQVNAHNSLQRLHHRRGGWEAGGNPAEDSEFFRRVAGTLDQTGQILVTGPGDAKLAFKTYLDQLHPKQAPQVHTAEMIDPPSHEILLTLGRAYFPLNPSATPHGDAPQPEL
jgi:stalled ribosome rescue protein Dom34